jgi:hypothetical protein
MPTSRPAARDDFASLLDARARATAGSGPGAPSPRRAGPVYAVGDDREGGSGSCEALDATDALARLYAEEGAHAATSPALACDREAIAGELGLTPALGARDLERIRREFALANHPDRAAPAARDLATRRMTIANTLIDQALQDRKRQAHR